MCSNEAKNNFNMRYGSEFQKKNNKRTLISQWQLSARSYIRTLNESYFYAFVVIILYNLMRL